MRLLFPHRAATSFLACLAWTALLPAAPSRKSAPVSPAAAAPASAQASDPLSAARRAYQAGDLPAAVSLGEAALKESPQDKPVASFLTEALVVSSIESYLLGNEEESYRFLARAMEITPDAEAVNRLYQRLKRERYAVPAERPPAARAAAPEEPVFRQMVEQVVRGQEKILTQTQVSLGAIVQSSQQEKKEILQSLEKRESFLVKEMGFARRYAAWLILGGTGLIVGVVGIVLFFTHRLAARREKILLEQGERFVQVMQEQQSLALEQLKDNFRLQAPPQVEGPAMGRPQLGTDIAEKLRRIDVIDAEIVESGRESSGIDWDVLRSLLEDPNPEVRARTIQVLIKYDLEEAYRRIQRMLAHPSAQMRLVGVRLLSGLATKKSAEILIGLLKDADVEIKKQAMAALQALLRENPPEDARTEIEVALAMISESEGWIVK